MDNLQCIKLNATSKIPKATSCKDLEKAKLHMDGEQISDCQGYDTGESLLQKSSMKEIWRVLDLLRNLSVMVLTWQYTLVSTHRTVTWKVNFTVCKF